MIRIPETGLAEDEVFRRLTEFGRTDVPWRDGRTFAYIYDAGPEVERVAKRAYMQYLTENALDPTAYPSLRRMENELVAMAAAHLGGDANVVGNFTTGGTESIILAVKAARDRLRARRPEIAQPEIVLPVTAHAAFHKAADYLGLRKIVVPVDRTTFKAVPAAIADVLSDRTALVVASAVSYAFGVLDPVEEIAALTRPRDIPFHVDGCIGGFVLPYFRRLGAPVPPFDFAVPGVTSMSMDFHKYAYCPKGASVVLHRDKSYRRHQIFACAEWAGYTIVNPTMLSAKSGGPLAAAWAVLNFIGDEGYLGFARDALAATRKIVAGIDAIAGLRVLGTPDSNLVAFGADGFPVFNIIDEMKERGWYVQPQFAVDGLPENVHLSIGHRALANVEAFLADLGRAVAPARAAGECALLPVVKSELQKMKPGAATDPAAFAMLMEALGVGGERLPKRSSELNQVLNALPAPMRKFALVEFFNDLYVQPRG